MQEIHNPFFAQQALIKQNRNSWLIMNNKFSHLQLLSSPKTTILCAARQHSTTGGVGALSHRNSLGRRMS